MSGNRASAVSTWPFFSLMASVFVIALGYGVMLPILPFFLERLVADTGRFTVSWHVGAITGVYAFAIFLFAPLWGRLSDRVGRRPVILVGLGGFAIMLGMFGVSGELWFAYAARALGGMFASSILPVSSAYIADMDSQDLRARRFAWMGTAGLLGFLAGPMLGGWLADAGAHWAGLAERAGVNLVVLPFIVAAALGMAVWFLVYLVMPRSAWLATEAIARDKPIALHGSRSVYVLLLLTFLLMFGLGSFEVGLTLHGQQKLSFGPDRLSLMFVACMLVMIATQVLVFPFLIKRWPIHIIASPAFAVMAVGMIFLPTALDFGWLLAAVVLVAAGAGLLAPIMSYRISLAAGNAQGAVLGKQAAASSLGQAIGAVVAGFGFGLMGPGLFWIAAGVLVSGAILSAGMQLLLAQPTTGRASRL